MSDKRWTGGKACRKKWVVENILTWRRILCVQEWRSVKSKESWPLLMPDEPNRGRTKVRKYLNFQILFFFILTVIWIFVLFLVCPFYSHWLLWFRPTASPKPSPTSPTSYHHSNQCPSAAGLFTGRAPETKTLSPVVQHHPKCLFQKMRPLSPLRSRREKV